ncbi:MAG: DUF1343 domain-containing protein [Pseudomonadota bacterium]
MGLAPAIDFFDRFRDGLADRKLGLVTNSAARNRDGQTTAEILAGDPDCNLACLFTPEHGFNLTAGPSEAVADGNFNGIPISTLYGERLAPTAQHLADLDALVIDLPSLGMRCFTYLATALRCLRAAAASGCPVLILDRPNPLGRKIEAPVGNALDRGLLCPMTIPLRYGMSLGEVLGMAAHEEGWPAPVIYACEESHHQPPWWPPSPNLPSIESALAYAGTVLIEGTALSEGRGTDAPFQNIGAPGLPADEVAGFLTNLKRPGLAIRPARFEPISSKQQGNLCNGVHITVVDPQCAEPVRLVLNLLGWVRDNTPELLEPTGLLDALWGGTDLRAWCQRSQSTVEALTASWQSSALTFEKRRRPFLLTSS